MSARGLALGDFDNDGAVDVLISGNDERARAAARTRSASQNHWLGVKLVGKKSNATPSARASLIRPAT